MTESQLPLGDILREPEEASRSHEGTHARQASQASQVDKEPDALQRAVAVQKPAISQRAVTSKQPKDTKRAVGGVMESGYHDDDSVLRARAS